MKILAIESSSMVASAAIVTDETVLAEYTINHKKTHSQTLLPMIDEIVTMTETDLSEIDAIAVSAGPGSYTGLRIGSATGKGLGLALGKPMIHIPTMDAMAYLFYGTERLICPMTDARRQQVYYGFYHCCERLEIVENQNLALIGEVVDRLNNIGEQVIFLGDAVALHKEYLAGHLKVPYSFAPEHLNRSKASSVGSLGIQYYREGRVESAAEHLPDYLRASQAERELQEKMKANKEK